MSDVSFKRVFILLRKSDKKFIVSYNDSCVKADKEQSWGSNSDKAMIKKNIIEFCDLSRPEDYSNNLFSPKLVIIDLITESLSSDAIVDFFY